MLSVYTTCNIVTDENPHKATNGTKKNAPTTENIVVTPEGWDVRAGDSANKCANTDKKFIHKSIIALAFWLISTNTEL